MLDAVTSLQTNVIATVRRERTDLPKTNTGTSDQTNQQSAPFVLNSTPVPETKVTNPLDSQIAELLQVAQTAAQSAAGIEPKAGQATLLSRATAAYERMTSYGSPSSPKALLSLTA